MEIKCYTAEEVKGILDSKQRIFDQMTEEVEKNRSLKADLAKLREELDEETRKNKLLSNECYRFSRERDGLNVEVKKRDEIIERVLNQQAVDKIVVGEVVEELRQLPISLILGYAGRELATRLEGLAK